MSTVTSLVVGTVTVGEKITDVYTSDTVVESVSVSHEVDPTVAVVSNVMLSQEVDE